MLFALLLRLKVDDKLFMCQFLFCFQRYLLQYAMQRLTSIAKQPLPDNPDGNLDLPQTHALNIMRALFRCSAINTDMHTYVGDAVEYAISGFASPFWAIRNCCMQLFGE